MIHLTLFSFFFVSKWKEGQKNRGAEVRRVITKKEFLAFDEEQRSNFMFHIPHFGLSHFMNVHVARKSC